MESLATPHFFRRVLLVMLACGMLVLAGCQSSEQTNAFLLLCKSGSLNEVEAALKKGSKVDAANESGITGLMVASAQDRPDVVKQLLAAGADVKKQTPHGTTALMFAVGRGSHAELVKALLDAGSDVNSHDAAGNTPLIFAAGDAPGLADDYALILDMKAPGAVEEKEDQTTSTVRDILHQAAQQSAKAGGSVLMLEDDAMRLLPGLGKTNDAELLSLLLAKGADVHAKNADGDNAFMMAADRQKGSAGLVVLSKAKVDVNARNNDGVNALSMAAAKGGSAAVLAVIEAGADVNALDADGQTALITAASDANAGPLHALIKAGTNVNVADKDGNTALMVAARRGNTAAVEALLKAGAQVAATNKAGASALGVSASEVRPLLIKAGGDTKDQARWMAQTDLGACVKDAQGYMGSLQATRKPGQLSMGSTTSDCAGFGQLVLPGLNPREDSPLSLQGEPVTVNYYGVGLHCRLVNNQATCEK